MDDLFSRAMHYEEMEQDERTAWLKLWVYFSQLGFETIPGSDKNILVQNTARINKEFDSIILDE